ncbi:MAG: hypothetical protein ACREXU_12510 [Gammaproteobacteria bacterium]
MNAGFDTPITAYRPCERCRADSWDLDGEPLAVFPRTHPVSRAARRDICRHPALRATGWQVALRIMVLPDHPLRRRRARTTQRPHLGIGIECHEV